VTKSAQQKDLNEAIHGRRVYLRLPVEVFKNSLFFPFVVALLGLGLIVLTVWMQRRVLALAER